MTETQAITVRIDPDIIKGVKRRAKKNKRSLTGQVATDLDRANQLMLTKYELRE